MFKKQSSADELEASMNSFQEASISLAENNLEQKYKLAIAYLMDAAEYFDLAGMEKEAYTTTKLIQKIAKVPEVITPQIVHDVFDPQRDYTPHVSGPKKIFEADKLVTEPEEKFIEPTERQEPVYDQFQLKQPKERKEEFVKPPVIKSDALRILRKHQRMAKHLTGPAGEIAKNEYISSVLYLRSILDGVPNPSIFTKYKLNHAPDWAADIAQLPNDKLEQLLREHLERTGGTVEGLERAYIGLEADKPQAVRAAVYPDKGGKYWITEFSNGDTQEYSTKEKAEAAAREIATSVYVSDNWLPGGRF